MSGCVAPDASVRAPRRIAAAVAVGLVLRLAVACFPKYTTGDEIWYVDMARRLVLGGAPYDELAGFARPPGTVGWVAAVFALFGADSVVPVRFANALLAAATPWLLARIARGAFPRLRDRLPVWAAWVQALNPVDIRGVQWVMSEALAVPLTLGIVACSVSLARRPTTRRALVFGLLSGALMLVRLDAAAVPAGAGLAALCVRWRRRRLRAGAVLRFGAAAAVALAACVPWSVFASQRFGRPVVVMTVAEHRPWAERDGWYRWVANSAFRRKDWLRVVWWGAREVDPEWIPDAAFASEAERREVLALIARDKEADALLPEVDAEFARIGEERRRAAPFRFLVTLPTYRTMNVWFDAFDDDIPRQMAPTQRSVPSWALEIALRIARPLAGVGFLVSLALVCRLGWTAAVPAAAIVVRTVSIHYAIPMLTGYGWHEGRYIAIVQPLALLLAVALVSDALKRRRQRRTRSTA